MLLLLWCKICVWLVLIWRSYISQDAKLYHNYFLFKVRWEKSLVGSTMMHEMGALAFFLASCTIYTFNFPIMLAPMAHQEGGTKLKILSIDVNFFFFFFWCIDVTYTIYSYMHNCIYLYVGLVMPHLRLSSTRNQESSRSMLSKCEREREREQLKWWGLTWI